MAFSTCPGYRQAQIVVERGLALLAGKALHLQYVPRVLVGRADRTAYILPDPRPIDFVAQVCF